MSKVWFVTGSSRGLGREFVDAALSRGDRVAPTARTAESLDVLQQVYADQLKAWADWQDLSAEARGALDRADR
ncbi:hypothetical protein MF672_015575 [Actinomadura sp. ATCC 31491]|uniref:SDR family NAD(P)-dependent oxidoreductase n=1 Tax=Actinomadura luzonensis TaxID=2805427 RepID=A0ABT0FS94_9ACTN|nr:hypothetical protein [Actinomadura luzonensis]MCK2215196.1 hypothetical protein [Actinomadura luzonensis]